MGLKEAEIVSFKEASTEKKNRTERPSAFSRPLLDYNGNHVGCAADMKVRVNDVRERGSKLLDYSQEELRLYCTYDAWCLSGALIG